MHVDTTNIQGIQASGSPIEASKPGHQNSVAGADGFEKVMQSLDTINRKLKTDSIDTNSQIRGLVVNSKPEKEAVSKALNSMLIAQFLSPLFAGSESSYFGSGVQGDITKSLLTDAIADAIAERGGIGLGDFI